MRMAVVITILITMIEMIKDGKQGQDMDKDKEMEIEWITR